MMISSEVKCAVILTNKLLYINTYKGSWEYDHFLDKLKAFWAGLRYHPGQGAGDHGQDSRKLESSLLTW